MHLAKELGYPENTKLLMIHADDAGLSHSENRATIQSLQNGIVNSYSIMVPCPWFYEISLFAKNNPEFDNGIHLTLTCEWENYKFGPVLPISEVPSLVDENGHFFRSREGVRNNARPDDVKKELTAQIEKAFKFGLAPTHLDSHMYSAGCKPELLQIYKELGKKYDLPILLSRQLIEMAGMTGSPNIEKNDLLVDKVHMGKDFFGKEGLQNYYNGIFGESVEGLNIILIHPAFDDAEMKGVTINHPSFGSEWRQVDFDAFTGTYLKSELKKSNVKLVTWRDIGKVTGNRAD